MKIAKWSIPYSGNPLVRCHRAARSPSLRNTWPPASLHLSRHAATGNHKSDQPSGGGGNYPRQVALELAMGQVNAHWAVCACGWPVTGRRRNRWDAPANLPTSLVAPCLLVAVSLDTQPRRTRTCVPAWARELQPRKGGAIVVTKQGQIIQPMMASDARRRHPHMTR
jgi:hypothetical protein